MLDQLSVLLLVVIPGAHLIEQLTNDILAQRRVTDDAVERGRMLQHVAETSRDVNRLGSEVFESITGAVLELGFQHTDVVAKVADGNWNVLADVGTLRLLPTPGEAASGLRPEDLATWEVFVDAEDPDPVDATELAATGAELLVRINLSTRDDTTIALRAAASDRTRLRSGAIEAFRLLAGRPPSRSRTSTWSPSCRPSTTRWSTRRPTTASPGCRTAPTSWSVSAVPWPTRRLRTGATQFSSWISTASSPSTTPSATRSAITCSRRSRSASKPRWVPGGSRRVPRRRRVHRSARTRAVAGCG